MPIDNGRPKEIRRAKTEQTESRDTVIGQLRGRGGEKTGKTRYMGNRRKCSFLHFATEGRNKDGPLGEGREQLGDRPSGRPEYKTGKGENSGAEKPADTSK